MKNQNPEQIARDKIDENLVASGWVIQKIEEINLHQSLGVAVREYLTDFGKSADYVLFIDGKACGIIEAKRQEEGHRINIHEEQAENYTKAQLKYLKNQPLPFFYIGTGNFFELILQDINSFEKFF